MGKKPEAYKALIRDNGANPFFWTIVYENGTFIQIRNWLTGERRCIHK